MYRRKSIVVLGWLMVISVAVGIGSAAQATTVLWYGKNCTDENGAVLKGGAVVQLIRSTDNAIGVPDPATGAPTGNDVVCATAAYVPAGSAIDHFQGDDWTETAGSYLCVRIWNAGDAAAATRYWDSAVYHASGMFPVDIDCIGAQTTKSK